ncbi:MAG: hypothetical protein U0797_01730 [Gemmataceae bacterium]
MLTISGKALGRKKPLFADFSAPLPPGLGDGGALTLRDLISHVVRHEVQAFQRRQEDRTLLHALTARQIEEGVAKGKVDLGGRDLKQKVDPERPSASPWRRSRTGSTLLWSMGRSSATSTRRFTSSRTAGWRSSAWSCSRGVEPC